MTESIQILHGENRKLQSNQEVTNMKLKEMQNLNSNLAVKVLKLTQQNTQMKRMKSRSRSSKDYPSLSTVKDVEEHEDSGDSK